MIDSLFVNRADLISEDVLKLFEEYLDIEADIIENQLQMIVSTFIDNIICFIECPYVDRFYRDSYYSFFARKHHLYNRDSIRISFFRDTIDIDKFYIESDLENAFLGYLTLRPTTFRIIGHTVLSPKILKNNNIVCCLCKRSVLINGRILTIIGFPYCSQDNESITCAETTLLNLMDYFGHKYPEYSTILPSQIARILSRQTYERQLPAQGLPTENISYVLKKLGFGTKVYSCGDKKSNVYSEKEFRDLMYIYIESGIPIIASLTDGTNYHAVLIIGRESIDKNSSFPKKCNLNSKDNDFSDFFQKVLIMNDNHAPYELVNYNDPIPGKKYHFSAFIVPLYSKVHLDAYQFKLFFKTVKQTIENKFSISFTCKEKYFYRYYLTSSRSYKNYLATSIEISDQFKAIVLNLSMPKFIWVGEIIKGNTIHVEQVLEGMIVLDATESGMLKHLIFATNNKCLIVQKEKQEDLENDYSEKKEIESNNIKANIGNKKEAEERNYKFYNKFEFSNEVFRIFANNLKGEHTKWQN